MAESKEDYASKQCSKCDQSDTKATVYCEDCRYYLCQSCHDAHQSWKAMKDHTIDTIEDLISGKAGVAEAEEEEWDQIGQIKVEGTGGSGLAGIAVTADDKIGVVDWGSKVYVMSKSGDVLHTLDERCNDLNITSDNGFVIPEKGSKCKVYDSSCKKVSEFKSLDLRNYNAYAETVTVDKKGSIIFGMDKALTIYKPDGTFSSGYAIPYEASSITVTSDSKIIVCNYSDGTMQVFKSYFSGKKPLSPFSAPPDVKKWKPKYVICSTKNEVFVSNGGDPHGVYKYAASGAYLGCVTTDVKDPRGIALSHDDQELYVVEGGQSHTVKIFEKP